MSISGKFNSPAQAEAHSDSQRYAFCGARRFLCACRRSTTSIAERNRQQA